MLFGKKKDMIDIRDLPKNVSTGKQFIPKDGYGFVDLTKKRLLPSEERKLKMLSNQPATPTLSSESASSFSFFDTPTPTSTSSSNYPSFSPATPSNPDTEESLRKISMQISDLDTKIYKIEQRIELLERKAGVSTPQNSGFSW